MWLPSIEIPVQRHHFRLYQNLFLPSPRVQESRRVCKAESLTKSKKSSDFKTVSFTVTARRKHASLLHFFTLKPPLLHVWGARWVLDIFGGRGVGIASEVTCVYIKV